MSLGEAGRELARALCVLTLLLAGFASAAPPAAAGTGPADPCGTLSGSDHGGAAAPCHACRPGDVVLPAPPADTARRAFTLICHRAAPVAALAPAPPPLPMARGPPAA